MTDATPRPTYTLEPEPKLHPFITKGLKDYFSNMKAERGLQMIGCRLPYDQLSSMVYQKHGHILNERFGLWRTVIGRGYGPSLSGRYGPSGGQGSDCWDSGCDPLRLGALRLWLSENYPATLDPDAPGSQSIYIRSALNTTCGWPVLTAEDERQLEKVMGGPKPAPVMNVREIDDCIRANELARDRF